MLDKKDLKVLAHFRNDARKNLTLISRQTSIPVSTLFDKLKKFEQTFIVKHTSLIDYRKLGYDIRLNIAVKAMPDKKDILKSALLMSQNINSVFRVNNGFDYIAEGIFRNMKDLDDFLETLTTIVSEHQEYYILEDLKREAFMSDENLAKYIA